MPKLDLPLTFTPVYQNVVWGGRRMADWRTDLPEGPVGESWDIAQQERGMSVVDSGPWAGVSLAELMADHASDLVGAADDGSGEFPLLIKLIDANDRLSVQVHPDDELAVELGVAPRGKTECWFCLGDGGELYQGTATGTTRAAFEAAIADNTVDQHLNRYVTRDGDFFFMPARTVHALGRGTLIYEIQQSCDCTFRVSDWGRVGLDGKPRPLHVAESLQTIDFSDADWGPTGGTFSELPAGGSERGLASCPYFSVTERRAETTRGEANGTAWVVICVAGEGTLSTAAGAVPLAPMRSVLVPASAGAWQAQAAAGTGLRLLVSQPR